MGMRSAIKYSKEDKVDNDIHTHAGIATSAAPPSHLKYRNA